MVGRYELEARHIPAALCSAPFILLGFYFLASISQPFWASFFAISFGGLSIAVALFFLFSFMCQLFGKWLEEKVFDKGLEFPTTTFLLDNSTETSKNYRMATIRRIKSRYKIDLSDATEDSVQNRRRIHEAIGQIRKTFFSRKGLVQQRNIYFGFSKNMAGGSILASIMSTITLVLSLTLNNSQVLTLSLFFLVIYLFSTIFFIGGMKFTARHYASSLFDEFLG